MEVAGVFFDLYGTLLVSADPDADWVAWREGFVKTLGRHGAELPPGALPALTESFMDRPEPTVLRHGFTMYEQRVHEFLLEMGVTVSPTAVREVADGAARAWHEGYGPDPEAAPALSHLREAGYRLALVSNFDHPPLLRERLAAAGLAIMFDVITVSAEVGTAKPDPLTFRPALRETGLGPEQVVHVGDSADDVNGALAAGIQPIHLRRDGIPGIPDREEVQQIADLADLIGLLEATRHSQ